ncbi:carboxylesterase/lipase family protein [Saccharibacillus sp. JS10]|uniref:carboxylesterase/lipase family protein n=1 Tax=Saccharibacillus sp. JS10 TaxID=2950552 RepID=UPI00210E59B0|nr:carboxylesterase/lipase family protein [Saccharibacillus sp. JS10]MCQ4086782.1 carboxylesterase/lipase family protein [Saccharibacillus sp. JS10]
MADTMTQTKQGQLRGSSSNGVSFWKGVPYAQPPIGDLRFRAPQPPTSWEGTRDALNYGSIALQPKPPEDSIFASPGVTMSEDCLYLNVWAPEDRAEKLPVMVWIHGGSFVTGSSSLPLYDGTVLARQSRCVVVSLNYRLGPLGFLHLSPLGEGFDSNVGLLDQVQALEWIKNNIEAFGGDPGNVTLFGESAGSMCIAALMAMPAAKGLFRKAIMQSGGAQSMSSVQGEIVAAAFLRGLNIDGGELERLKTFTSEELMIAASQMQPQAGESWPALPFQPVVEEATLPEEPLLAVSQGAAKGVDLLIGTNHDEGHFFIREQSQVTSPEQTVHTIRALTGVQDVEAWIAAYPSTIDGQAQMMTDVYFWRASLQFAEAQAQYASVWMYRFDWTFPGHPFFGKAVHAAEMPFVFGNTALLPLVGVRVDSSLQQVSDSMRSAWQAFAASGDPSTSELPWTPYKNETRDTMIFNTNSKLEQDPQQQKRQQLFI